MTPHPTELSDETFCIAAVVRHARELSYRDGLRVLRGLAKLAGDSAEVADLRDALLKVEEGDAQLELIADRQMKLQLEAKPAA